MSWALFAMGLLLGATFGLLLFSLLAMSGRDEAEEAHRHLVDLLTERAERQARTDDRALADNLDL